MSMPWNKLTNFIQLIVDNGGIRKSLRRIYLMDDLRMGEVMGKDDYGHTYYENRNYFFGRSRWVTYPEHMNMEYDPSQIPAEWYGWLHHTTDLTPKEDCSRPTYKWMSRHTQNMTGTREQYVPYSTTVPKIEAWVPPGEYCRKMAEVRSQKTKTCEVQAKKQTCEETCGESL